LEVHLQFGNHKRDQSLKLSILQEAYQKHPCHSQVSPCLLKKILLFLLGIIVLIGGGVWYLLQPKNLGISYTPADLASIYKKVGVSFEPLPDGTPPGKSLIVSGSIPSTRYFQAPSLPQPQIPAPTNMPIFRSGMCKLR